jgi:hypothetical protein
LAELADWSVGEGAIGDVAICEDAICVPENGGTEVAT